MTTAADDEETDVLEGKMLGADLGDQDPHIFTTSPDSPADGRTFVWTSNGWFERIEDDESGAVEFSPLSMDEHALREWLSEQDLEITELDDDYTALVRDEFLNEGTLYMEAPELSNQELETNS